MTQVHPVDSLFRMLPFVEPYGSGMVEVPSRLKGLAFFPGGDGLWKEPGITFRAELPIGKIMVIGNNFQCTSNFTKLEVLGEENPDQDPTWRNLLALLSEVGINRSDCFFTNAFIGLVEGDDPTVTVTGMRDLGFLSRCREFMKAQIALLKPRLILGLGTKVPSFLAPLANLPAHWAAAKAWRDIDKGNGPLYPSAVFPGVGHATTVACLLHPCLRHSNLRFRKYGALVGAEAELALLRDGLNLSGLHADQLRQDQGSLQVSHSDPPISSSAKCICCAMNMPTTTPRACPSCGMIFQGHGWAGFHFHWRSAHEGERSYESVMDRLCPEHGGRS
jgi:hypothetical protein